MKISFKKFNGCGNDFILIDHREKIFPDSQLKEISQKLCHRQLGIGADGLILLESSSLAQFRMRIFNSDGSEAEMCGNGIRCLIKFMESIALHYPEYAIETRSGIFKGCIENASVTIQMNVPKDEEWGIPLVIDQERFILHALNTGVPHVVIFVNDIEKVAVTKLGNLIRHHSYWQPGGTNVNFAQKISPQEYKIRTYERGVEAETLACGTGATALGLVAMKLYNETNQVIVETRSGSSLKIGCRYDSSHFSHITMTGPAIEVFQGESKLTVLLA